MGLEIKEQGGRYNIKSSIGGGRIHDKKWVTEDEAKKALMDREVFKFLEKIKEIDMEFPNAYSVNGEYRRDNCEFLDWSIAEMKNKSNSYYETLLREFGEIRNRLKLDYNFIDEEE